MIPWIDIAGLAISVASGTSAALRQVVQKHPGLSDRMKALYADALKSWLEIPKENDPGCLLRK